MRALCTLILLVAASSGEHFSYSAQPGAQKGLLVLPKQGPTSTSTTTTTPAPRYNNKENLEDVNSQILERLKQEQGSQQGEYHVYLQDGRLQKVQYVTAPIVSGQQAQQPQYASNNYNQQQQQAPAILSPEFAEKRGVYFVEVPQERIQQLKNYNQQISQQSSQTAQGFNSFQFSQQNAQTNFQFPQPQGSSQYTEAQKGYLASVEFSPVEPITGPVYSYKPEPLTRILRYAPSFY